MYFANTFVHIFLLIHFICACVLKFNGIRFDYSDFTINEKVNTNKLITKG